MNYCLACMIIGAIGDTPYNIVYAIHLFSVMLGTGMAFLAPYMAVKARRESGRGVQEFVDDAAAAIIFPSLLVAGCAGGALVGFSADAYDFQQTWLSVGGAIWMATLVFSVLAYPPRWLRLFNLTEERRRFVGGLLHVSLAIMLVLMTWKFGVGG